MHIYLTCNWEIRKYPLITSIKDNKITYQYLTVACNCHCSLTNAVTLSRDGGDGHTYPGRKSRGSERLKHLVQLVWTRSSECRIKLPTLKPSPRYIVDEHSFWNRFSAKPQMSRKCCETVVRHDFIPTSRPRLLRSNPTSKYLKSRSSVKQQSKFVSQFLV